MDNHMDHQINEQHYKNKMYKSLKMIEINFHRYIKLISEFNRYRNDLTIISAKRQYYNKYF